MSHMLYKRGAVASRAAAATPVATCSSNVPLHPRRPSTSAAKLAPRMAVTAASSSAAPGAAASLASPASSSSASSRSAAPATASTAEVDDFATDKRPVILYDGVCNLCNGAVNLMLDWDPEGRFRMAALQGSAGRRLLARCGRRPDDISSIVLVEDGGRHHIKSEAVLRIAQGLPPSGGLPLLALFGLPVPRFLRDFLYDQVADNRYNILGKRDVCRLTDDGFASRFIAE